MPYGSSIAKPANRFRRFEIYSQPQKIILLCGAYL